MTLPLNHSNELVALCAKQLAEEAKSANSDGYDAGLNGYGFHNPINPWKRDVWRAWNDGFIEGQAKCCLGAAL